MDPRSGRPAANPANDVPPSPLPPHLWREPAAGGARLWRAGAFLHRIARAADGHLAASSRGEALAWATRISRERGRKVASIQAWGHGGWWDPREGVRFQGGEATGALWSSADAPSTV